MNNRTLEDQEKEWKKKYDVKTYRDYVKLGDSNTSPYLMLSELIDNAIASMQNRFLCEDWREKLIVKIDFKFITDNNDKQNCKNLYSQQVFPNDYIIVSDNAFGMSSHELRDAMKLNKISASKTPLNTHGRGLKQSGFFFGVDLIVNTNNELDSNIISLELSEQKSLDDEIIFEPKKSQKENRGTDIYINNIHKKNRITPKNWENIEAALSERYRRFIQGRKLVINFDVKIMDYERKGTIQSNETFTSKVLKVFNKDDIEKVVQNSHNSLEEKFKNQSNYLTKHKDLALRTFGIIEHLLMSSRNDKEADFKFIVPILFNNKEVDVKFWMLEPKKGAFRGLRVYEQDRAILHPPIKKDEQSTYIDWYTISLRTGSTINRFAGEFDMHKCDLKTTIDKSNFSIDRKTREDMNEKVMVVWEVFDSFVMSSRKELNNEPGKNMTSQEWNNIESIFDSKYSNKKIKFIGENRKYNSVTVRAILDSGEEWEFEIQINTEASPNDVFSCDCDHEEKRLLILAYTGHPFWKTITNAHRSVTEIVHPLSILMGYQHLKAIGKGEITSVFNKTAEMFKK